MKGLIVLIDLKTARTNYINKEKQPISLVEFENEIMKGNININDYLANFNS